MRAFVFFALLLCSVPGRCEFLVYAGDLPPYNYLDEQHRMRGPSVEILAEIMRRSGLAFDPTCIKHVPWARAMSETEFRPWRMIVGIVRTEERDKRFKWVGPYCTAHPGLIADRTRALRPSGPDALAGYMIGVIRGSAFVDMLLGLGVPQSHLVPVGDFTQLLSMLQAGRVDCIAGGKALTRILLLRAGLNPDAYEMIYPLGSVDIYYALNLRTEDSIVARMQNALDEMRQTPARGCSALDVILSRYRLVDSPPRSN